jgi:hypothetical protein
MIVTVFTIYSKVAIYFAVERIFPVVGGKNGGDFHSAERGWIRPEATQTVTQRRK